MQEFLFRIGKLFLLTMIALAVGFISFFTAMKWGISGQEVAIHGIVGDNLEQARKLLHNVGLEIKVQGERYDRSVARGSVSVQLPPSGTSIKKGNVVSVIVSLGNRVNPIPDLQ